MNRIQLRAIGLMIAALPLGVTLLVCLVHSFLPGIAAGVVAVAWWWWAVGQVTDDWEKHGRE